MAKDLEISLLYDFYGELLTEKQREVIELYYNEDLSLAEIATHGDITRQGVRDCIKRAEYQLLEFENKLGLAARFREIRDSLEVIILKCGEIDRVNEVGKASRDISMRTDDIRKLARQLAH